MAYQTPQTIAKAIKAIQRREYVLPAIQREFVWDSEQIERLFDSLMRDYPISTFLFWKVNKERVEDYQFYEFLQRYHERKRRHNNPASLTGDDGVIAVLDGQQRLTSLYVALTGSYAKKLKYLRKDSENSYPEKKLYLNLLQPCDDVDMFYDFRFLNEEELESNDPSVWFEVSKILNFENLSSGMLFLMNEGITDTSRFSREQGEFALNTLNKLYNVIHEKGTLSYFLEESEDLEKVLQIFIRINSGGTKLSYSDLLLSIATAQWNQLDARNVIHEFVDEINDIGAGFEFSKDFVLKACLVLSDIRDIKFKVENFTKKNMSKIESEWNEISSAVKLAVKLCAKFGFNRDTLRAGNAVIPIAYFLMHNKHDETFLQKGSFSGDRIAIRQWLSRALLKHVFGGTPDNIYPIMRGIIQKHAGRFPLVEIIDHYKGTSKSISFSEDDINSLLDWKYGDKLMFTALSLVYPALNFNTSYHIDHIHPRKGFHRNSLSKLGITDAFDQDELKDLAEQMPNLQFLQSTTNVEKSDKAFDAWLNMEFPGPDERLSFLQSNHIPNGMSLDLTNFREFHERRRQILRGKLTIALGVQSGMEVES